jgi:hypothetical protein
MTDRIEAMAKHCKNRGGDCQCRGPCQAIIETERELQSLSVQQVYLQRQRERLENLTKRLKDPMATLKDGFTFEKRGEPVMVFDGENSEFGYEDTDGEWTEADWPFNESGIWPDDCERHGIRVEVA